MGLEIWGCSRHSALVSQLGVSRPAHRGEELLEAPCSRAMGGVSRTSLPSSDLGCEVGVRGKAGGCGWGSG